MCIKIIKPARKLAHILLVTFPTLYPTITKAETSLIAEEFGKQTDRIGKTFSPILKEDILEDLERKPKLLFDYYKKREDEVNRDLKKPPMGNHQQYRDFHNSMVDKLAKDNPELLRHKIAAKSEKQGSTLVSSSNEFLHAAKRLREAEEAKNNKIQKNTETVITTAGNLAKGYIETKVSDPTTKGFAMDLIENITNTLRDLFSL